MGQTRPISLFAEQPASHEKPYSFVASSVVHVSVAGLILYGFLFAPRINMKEAAERYTVRQVDLSSADPERKPSAAAGLYPGQSGASHSAVAHSAPAVAAASLRQIPRLHVADRTVVQPDVPITPLMLKHTPLPSLLLWAQSKANVKLLTAPQPQKMANVTAKPLLTRPTQQINVTDVPITATPFTTKAPMPVPSSSTPVQVRGPDLAQRIPQTSSNISVESASGAVMSISEMHLAQGTIIVPALNQTAAGNANGAMGAGKTGNSLQNGPGNGHGAQNGSPQSQGSGGNSVGSAGNQHGTNAGGGANSGSGNSTGNAKNNAGAGGGGAGGAGQGTEPSFTRISLPPSGQFGVVVVGSAMSDQFPETAQLWGGRLTYSVYLRVGLAHNWILQYSLPAAEDAAAAGGVNHVDAPWPFYIVRPNDSLANVNADALMIHGFVNDTGHFESLSVVFPPNFRRAQALLAALQQWQFRPAKNNGHAAKVEIVLIIPESEN